MDINSRVIGVAWKHKTLLSMKEYEAFMNRPDAVLRIVMVGGTVQGELPLFMVPTVDPSSDDFYVFPEAIVAGAIARWEAPKEILLRLSIQGEGFYWTEPSQTLEVP